jgi:beta-mannosidase
MVLPWQLNESYPNAWCTSSVDYRGDAKPAFHAVTRAFAPERATIRVDRSAWAGHDTATAAVWLWSESGRSAGGRVVIRLRTVDGESLGETSTTLEAVSEPRHAVELSVPLDRARAGASAIMLWEAEWTEATGDLVDREVSLASVSSDLSGLLDLPRATVDVGVEQEPDGEADGVSVRVRHAGGPAVFGLRVVDGRPAGSPGWVVTDGDPRPLMPGEERVFHVRWRDDPHLRGGDRSLILESWNTEPVTIHAAN